MTSNEHIASYIALVALRSEVLERAFTNAIEGSYAQYIIRDPYGKREYIRPCKLVCVVEDTETAEKLKSKIEKDIAETNQRRNQLAELSQALIKDISLKIQTIRVKGNISVSISGAQRRMSVTGEEAINHIIERIEQLKRNECDQDAEDAKKLLALIDKKELYTVAKESGKSYRVTYYDPSKGCRAQCSIGNILIAIGKGVDIMQSSPRKERSDASEALGIYDVWYKDNGNLCEVSLIYPFNYNYQKRRLDRLSKANDEE